MAINPYQYSKNTRNFRITITNILGTIEFIGWLISLFLIFYACYKMIPYFISIQAKELPTLRDMARYLSDAIQIYELIIIPGLLCSITTCLLMLCILRKCLIQCAGSWVEVLGEISFLIFFLFASNLDRLVAFPEFYQISINFIIC